MMASSSTYFTVATTLISTLSPRSISAIVSSADALAHTAPPRRTVKHRVVELAAPRVVRARVRAEVH
jgi:hypothetical protein